MSDLEGIINKTDQIFQLSAPYNNPYQGKASRILFVCSAGLLRSPTGAAVGVKRGYNTRSCGSDASYALIPLSVNLIEWANHIVFVNQKNYEQAIKDFKKVRYDEIIKSKSIVLDIPDKYDAFHPSLVRKFKDWFDKWEKNEN
jgi:predicted protein tyrosine phosphatase